MEQARQPAQRSQLTECGFSRHLGQCTQSMQKGRCEPEARGVQGSLLAAALADTEHARDERV